MSNTPSLLQKIEIGPFKWKLILSNLIVAGLLFAAVGDALRESHRIDIAIALAAAFVLNLVVTRFALGDNGGLA